jgi:hypothetical protein
MHSLEISYSEPTVPFELASFLLSCIAFAGDGSKQSAFERALCRRELSNADRGLHGSTESVPRLIRPVVFISSKCDYYNDGVRNIRRRLSLAAKMLPLVQSYETNAKPPKVGGARLFVYDVASAVTIEHGLSEGTASTVLDDWGKIRPLAHLAFALAELVYEKRSMEPVGGWKDLRLSPLPDEESSLQVLERAEHIRLLLPEIKWLRFKTERLVKLVPRRIRI